jgi:predicted dinucleotide-binding enzyme
MKVAVLGTGGVGQTIGKKLVELGHEVRMGSRDASHAKGLEWAKACGERASLGLFGDAAGFGELVFNCLSGRAALDVLGALLPELAGKVVVDVSNPLDFSKGFPPSLFTAAGDSLGEQLQRALPSSRVVKALNHVNSDVMVAPQLVAGGDHEALICGNDAGAKQQVSELLRSFGWQRFLDLGDIKASRGMEGYLLFWVNLMGALGTPHFSVKVVK